MNDFTKEELLTIRNNLSADYDPETNNVIYSCYEKLQDMIASYCEHEFVIPQFSTVEECYKCKQYVTHKVIE